MVSSLMFWKKILEHNVLHLEDAINVPSKTHSRRSNRAMLV